MEIKNILNWNNENMIYQNLWDIAKAMCYELNVCVPQTSET